MKINMQTVLLGVIIALILFLMNSNRLRDKRIVEPHTKYVTDTVWEKKYYALKVKYDQKTPPKTVVKWLKPKRNISDSIRIINDTIKIYVTVPINDKQETVNIDPNFLFLYPTNEKLIEFDLQSNNMDITTLDIQGNLKTNKYPLYLDNHKYQYYDNEMHNSKFKKPRKKVDFTRLYINTKYDYLNKTNTLGIDYSLEFGRFKIYTEPNITLQPVTNQFNMDLGIGYRLIK